MDSESTKGMTRAGWAVLKEGRKETVDPMDLPSMGDVLGALIEGILYMTVVLVAIGAIIWVLF